MVYNINVKAQFKQAAGIAKFYKTSPLIAPPINSSTRLKIAC